MSEQTEPQELQRIEDFVKWLPEQWKWTTIHLLRDKFQLAGTFVCRADLDAVLDGRLYADEDVPEEVRKEMWDFAVGEWEWRHMADAGANDRNDWLVDLVDKAVEHTGWADKLKNYRGA